MKKQIPQFKTEAEEKEFWENNDTTDYFESKKNISLDLSVLKPSSKNVTLRMPELMISSLKRIANKNDVPYQSLIKIFLMEKIKEHENLGVK